MPISELMRIAAFISLFLMASLLPAKDKVTDRSYQSAVLVNFRAQESGMYCSGSGTVRGEENESGEITGSTSGSSRCDPRATWYYTVTTGEHVYVIRPAVTGKQVGLAAATLGYPNFFRKGSVLQNQMPGSKVLLRSNEHALWVKVGKRESRFEIVEAR